MYIYRDNCNSVLLVSVENQRETHPRKNHLHSGGRFTKYTGSNDGGKKNTHNQDVSMLENRDMIRKKSIYFEDTVLL